MKYTPTNMYCRKKIIISKYFYSYANAFSGIVLYERCKYSARH